MIIFQGTFVHFWRGWWIRLIFKTATNKTPPNDSATTWSSFGQNTYWKKCKGWYFLYKKYSSKSRETDLLLVIILKIPLQPPQKKTERKRVYIHIYPRILNIPFFPHNLEQPQLPPLNSRDRCSKLHTRRWPPCLVWTWKNWPWWALKGTIDHDEVRVGKQLSGSTGHAGRCVCSIIFNQRVMSKACVVLLHYSSNWYKHCCKQTDHHLGICPKNWTPYRVLHVDAEA